MRILFYADWPLSWPYLTPMFNYMKALNEKYDRHWELGRWDSTNMGSSGDLDYDYVFVTDEESNCPAKGTYVNLTHGLASKGQSWSTSRKDTYLNYPGFIVCPSEYYKDLLTNMGVSEDKLIVAGLTKFDGIKKIPPLREKPRVLFAPTWNPELSAISVLKDSIYEIEGVKVHLHERSRSHSDAPQLYPRYSSGDVTQAILDSDIVIADFGSTVLEAMALGKYVIQVANPEHEEWYLKKKSIPSFDLPKLPEFFYTYKYARRAVEIDGVKHSIQDYMRYDKGYASCPDWLDTIVENIGNASEVIYESLFGGKAD